MSCRASSSANGTTTLRLPTEQQALEVLPCFMDAIVGIEVHGRAVCATFSSTVPVCSSLSSTSSEIMRVSFSGCSAALVVVTMKRTGPFLSMVTAVIDCR